MLITVIAVGIIFIIGYCVMVYAYHRHAIEENENPR